MATTPKAELSPREIMARDRLIADVHVGEYQAAENRLTYWITLQYATYSVAAVALGAVQLFKGSTAVWASAVVLQLAAWIWLQTGCEMGFNVLYIEEHLKPRLKQVIRDETFWEYEIYLKNIRSRGFVRFEWRFGSLFPYLLALAAIVWLIYAKVPHPWNVSDWLWALGFLYLSGMAFLKARQGYNLQMRMKRLSSSVDVN